MNAKEISVRELNDVLDKVERRTGSRPTLVRADMVNISPYEFGIVLLLEYSSPVEDGSRSQRGGGGATGVRTMVLNISAATVRTERDGAFFIATRDGAVNETPDNTFDDLI